MPIGFLPTPESAIGVTLSNDERNVVNYLAGLMKEAHDDTVQDFHVSLDVNISFKRTSCIFCQSSFHYGIVEPSDPAFPQRFQPAPQFASPRTQTLQFGS